MTHVSTPNAPAALGPYSQAVDTGSTVYCSGQLGLDPATGNLADGVQAQTHQALKNLQAVLNEAGLSLDNVVKTTVFVQESGRFRHRERDLRHLLPRRLPRPQLRPNRRPAQERPRRDRVHRGTVIAHF